MQQNHKGRGKYLPLIRWSIPTIGFWVIALLFASPGWTEIVTAAILLVGIVLLILLPINHKRELAIQAAIEEKHGKQPNMEPL